MNQNPATFTGREGSNPSSGAKSPALRMTGGDACPFGLRWVTMPVVGEFNILIQFEEAASFHDPTKFDCSERGCRCGGRERWHALERSPWRSVARDERTVADPPNLPAAADMLVD